MSREFFSDSRMPVAVRSDEALIRDLSSGSADAPAAPDAPDFAAAAFARSAFSAAFFLRKDRWLRVV